VGKIEKAPVAEATGADEFNLHSNCHKDN